MYSIMIDKYYQLYDMAMISAESVNSHDEIEAIIAKLQRLTRELEKMYRLSHEDIIRVEHIMFGDINVINQLYLLNKQA